ncbi:ankyrin repeat domain-containing protein [Acinetobacter baumannii]|uniref:ankyrin repeat domain-containing protein n=1 Tax=Acinetobacter baumannii TaxID=470 RepID=UPI0007EC7225|nr:ankyrin repeat domain-containing protein [Acinetobacter baumannii]OBL61088.1 hypothetical protein A9921_15190 [Acinetobacter baumannii]
MHDASAHGRPILLEYLVNKGADINERGGVLGGNALNEAVKNQHIDIRPLAKVVIASSSDLPVQRLS